MKRIKITESNQGNGMTRVQDEAWLRLLELDNGYFEKNGNVYDFYTNDGLLIRAVKNSDDYMANHFAAKGNLLYVDYCEPGLGISLMDENTSNTNQFLFRSTGFYDAFGKSFFIKLEVSEQDETVNIPDVWSFQATYKKTEIENLRLFLFNSIFEHPQEGEVLCKRSDETDEIILCYKGKYGRKLCTHMSDTLHDSSYKGDRSFQTIYFSLKSAKLVKEHSDFVNFS